MAKQEYFVSLCGRKITLYEEEKLYSCVQSYCKPLQYKNIGESWGYDLEECQLRIKRKEAQSVYRLKRP